jgi:hypothetical protein
VPVDVAFGVDVAPDRFGVGGGDRADIFDAFGRDLGHLVPKELGESALPFTQLANRVRRVGDVEVKRPLLPVGL